MSCLHELKKHNIVFRDLSGKNIVIHKGKHQNDYSFKVADFSLAEFDYEPGKPYPICLYVIYNSISIKMMSLLSGSMLGIIHGIQDKT